LVGVLGIAGIQPGGTGVAVRADGLGEGVEIGVIV
jgi:hypothetical protein